MNESTMTSLSKTEVENVARLTYEEKDILTAKELEYCYEPKAYKNLLDPGQLQILRIIQDEIFYD